MRMRRTRGNPLIREMIAETSLKVSDFIYPLFIVEGSDIKREIPSLPEVYHFSVDRLEDEIRELEELGIKTLLLFGVPDDIDKDSIGSAAYDDNGVVQRAIRKIREISDKILIITDVCMCEYTDHGHCGLLDDKGVVKNDETIKELAKISLSHVRAGAHIVAPSDMMDFRVSEIRKTLDENGYSDIPIMAYSAKYSSNYYGPFREAAGSAPSFGDRKSYQMDTRNSDEALVEIGLDLEEDADFVIIKPALAYLDIIQRTKDEFNTNIVAYNVSGEYAMIKNAVKNGILDDSVIYETLLSIKRAGAKNIITYHAKDIAKKLKEGYFELI